jgi:hypothetical protein
VKGSCNELYYSTTLCAFFGMQKEKGELIWLFVIFSESFYEGASELSSKRLAI